MFCCKRCGKRKRKWWSGQKIALGEKEDTQKRRGSLDMDADEDLGGHVATTRLLCHHMTGSKRAYAKSRNQRRKRRRQRFNICAEQLEARNRNCGIYLTVMDRDLERWRQAAASDGAELPELASTGAPRNAET